MASAFYELPDLGELTIRFNKLLTGGHSMRHASSNMGKVNWTNRSVLKFAGDRDPMEAIEQSARMVALRAMDLGWSGPPYDPIRLADLLGIPVMPSADIKDARTVPLGPKKFRIEFNPTRPPGRVRFSIAHEIAHTFFPDCGERIRNRSVHLAQDDSWQLEILCNLAAAELVMPVGSLLDSVGPETSIEDVLQLRRKYDVSVEALLIRIAKVTDQPWAVFASSRRDHGSSGYRLDYVVPSRSYNLDLPPGIALPSDSCISECTAIGYTAKRSERWAESLPKIRVECVGLPPFPDQTTPRVVGLIKPVSTQRREVPRISYLRGNALEPRGGDRKIIAHIVNDSTSNWGGGGIAVAIRKRWPQIQESFRDWAKSERGCLRLGCTHGDKAEERTYIFSMIAQRGYGPSPEPRIRYASLETCLHALAGYAKEEGASVHMPKIGTGQAGGSWKIISELLEEKLIRQDISVTVYDPPESTQSRHQN